MTDGKNKNNSKENFDTENIPMRSMQDDIDSLDGKVPAKKENKKEKSRGLFGGKKGVKKPDPEKSNPFLNNGFSSKGSMGDIGFENKDKNVPIAAKKIMKKEPDIGKNHSSGQKKQPPSKKPRWNKVVIILVVIVVILIISGGGYYYWSTRTTDVAEQPQLQPQQDPAIEQPIIEVPQTKFSEDNPNYLNIDVETDTKESVSELISKTASEVKDSGTDQAIEFLIRDSNNNPIAFSVFAFILEVEDLNDDILSNLEEDFSMYLYNDAGSMKLGLTIDLKDKEVFSEAFRDDENNLVDEFSFIFLGKKIEKSEILFKDGKYKDFSIRYFNIDDSNLTSFDYTFSDKQVIIGTSQKATSAIIDKTVKGKKMILEDILNSAETDKENLEDEEELVNEEEAVTTEDLGLVSNNEEAE